MLAVPLDINNIKAIVFDLDNTLVSSNMDFQWLRQKIGCPLDEDLLSYVDALPCSKESAIAQQLILDHELNDAQHSSPMPGCLELLRYIEHNQLHTAIVTRNCIEATQQKLTLNQLSIERVICREHFPPKPAPDSLIALANEWGLQASEVLYVGDYLYDLQAALNALMPSCLVSHGHDYHFSQHASVVVEHLSDLCLLFEQTLQPQTSV